MAHTPGPWKVSELDARTIGPSRLLVLAGSEIPQLQGVAIVTLRMNETEANARLIAAAPTLLQVLKDVALVDQRSPSTVLTAEMRAIVLAAIALAEGHDASR